MMQAQMGMGGGGGQPGQQPDMNKIFAAEVRTPTEAAAGAAHTTAASTRQPPPPCVPLLLCPALDGVVRARRRRTCSSSSTRGLSTARRIACSGAAPRRPS
eukprot:3621134-Prymnesium_polylepis.1